MSVSIDARLNHENSGTIFYVPVFSQYIDIKSFEQTIKVFLYPRLQALQIFPNMEHIFFLFKVKNNKQKIVVKYKIKREQTSKQRV